MKKSLLLQRHREREREREGQMETLYLRRGFGDCVSGLAGEEDDRDVAKKGRVSEC